MSSPILHGTALCPLLRFPRGGRTQIRVVMDEALDLAGDVDDILFAARARYGADRATLRYSRSGTAEAWTAAAPNTATLSLAPDAADETEGSERTLADLHEEGAGAWRMDFLDGGGLPLARIQGDIEYLPEEGDWTDDPASETTLPSLTVALVNGAVAVTVSLISDGVTVDNASVVTAIEEDPAAVRTSLELGTAALASSGDFATGAEGDLAATALQPAAIGVTVLAPNGNGSALTALNPSALGIGTGAITLQAGGTNQALKLFASGSGPVELGQYGNPIWFGNGIQATNAVGHPFFYLDWAGNFLIGVALQPQADGGQSLGKTDRRWQRLWINSTVTPPGTVGAQTINKGAGAVNFAPAASSLVVTNSLVTADSHVLAIVASNDSTMKAVRVVAGAGSFTLYADTVPSAEARVDFFVIN